MIRGSTTRRLELRASRNARDATPSRKGTPSRDVTPAPRSSRLVKPYSRHLLHSLYARSPLVAGHHRLSRAPARASRSATTTASSSPRTASPSSTSPTPPGSSSTASTARRPSEYLEDRAAKGFTVIQAVVLAELDGVTDPNAYGKLPLIDKDPTRPVPETTASTWTTSSTRPKLAASTSACCPTWGRWVNNAGRADESLLTPANAQTYGEFLGKRYGARASSGFSAATAPPPGSKPHGAPSPRGMADRRSGKEDYDAVLMSFHPRGGETSSTWFHDEPWLDFNMQQTGHGLADTVKSWDRIGKDYDRTPVKPVIDGEPLYEDHPLAFRSRELRLLVRRARPPARLLGRLLRRRRPHLRQPLGLADVRARPQARQRPADAIGTRRSTAPAPPRCSMSARWSNRARTCRASPTSPSSPTPSKAPTTSVATRGDGYAFIYSRAGPQVHRPDGQTRRAPR